MSKQHLAFRRCHYCGHEYEVGVQIGARGKATCEGCAVLVKRRCTAMHYWRNRLPEGTRQCGRCGRPFEREPNKRSKFCEPCRVERRTAYQRIYRAEHIDKFREYERNFRERIYSDPYLTEQFRARSREQARRLKAADPERYRAAQRRTYAKRRADPERWRQWLDEQNERTRARRIARGLPIRVLRPATYNARFGGPMYPRVPAAPVVEVLNDWLSDPGHHQITLTEITHVPERVVRRILIGEQTKIALGTADKLCAAVDVPMSLVYPEAS